VTDVTQRKALKNSSILKKCSSVVAVLSDTDEFPEAVKTLLVNSLPLSLGVPKDQRQEVQDMAVNMIGDALTKIEERFAQRIVEAEATVQTVTAEHTRCESFRQEAERSQAAMNEALFARQTANIADEAALQRAELEVGRAHVSLERSVQERDEAISNKRKLEERVASVYTPLKEGRAKGKRAITALQTLGRQFHFDNNMMQALSSPLAKDLTVRSTFDGLVQSQFEDAVAARLLELSAKGEALEASFAEQEAATRALECTRDEWQAKLDASSDAVAQTQARCLECDVSQKSVQEEMKWCVLKLADAIAERDDMIRQHKEFRDGPMQAYWELQEQRTGCQTPVAAEVEECSQPRLVVMGEMPQSPQCLVLLQPRDGERKESLGSSSPAATARSST
jgi:hypothetical protein